MLNFRKINSVDPNQLASGDQDLHFLSKKHLLLVSDSKTRVNGNVTHPVEKCFCFIILFISMLFYFPGTLCHF